MALWRLLTCSLSDTDVHVHQRAYVPSVTQKLMPRHLSTRELKGNQGSRLCNKRITVLGREQALSLVFLPVSFATILAICERSLLSSSCRAVVRLSAVTPGFLSPSMRLPSRRKLGTEEFRWSTRRGVGRHSCFRGRVSLLENKVFRVIDCLYTQKHTQI